MTNNIGDCFKRIKISDTHYQCGCFWFRDEDWGDVLKQCPIHDQATIASVTKFDRERKPKQ